MPTPPPTRRKKVLKDPLFLAYLDLYCLHRGVLAMLVKHGVAPPERFEAEVIQWTQRERPKLLGEALERFQGYVERLADAGLEPDQPPEGKPGSGGSPAR